MSKSRISAVLLFALAQQFGAASAFAEAPCPPVGQKPGAGDNCPPEPSPPPPAPSAKPDLVPSISNVSFADGKVVVATSISNQGQAAAVQTKTRIELFKEQGSGFAAAPFHTQDVVLGAVQPSAALTLSAEAPVVPGFHRRSHKVCVTADALQQVQENIENNNKACKQATLGFVGTIP